MLRGKKYLTTITLDKENYENLKKLAEDENRSMSSTINMVTKFYFNFRKNIKQYK